MNKKFQQATMFGKKQNIRRKTIFFITTILLALCLSGIAYTADSLRYINNLSLGVKAKYGFVYPHHPSINYLINSNIEGFELTLTTNTYGRNAWDELFRYPQLGLGFVHTNLGNDAVFGRANALFAFTDIPFSRKNHKFSSQYRIGMGIGYLGTIFDRNENPLNMSISTKLNIYIDFQLSVRYKLNSRSEIFTGLGASHFSNGKISTPNQGINLINASAGYFYAIVPEKFSRIKSIDLNKKPKRNNFEIVISGGIKSDDQLTEIIYPVSTLVLDYKYLTSTRYSIGIGGDFFYDASLGPNMKADLGVDLGKYSLFQLGSHAAFHVRYSRLNVLVNLGYYLYADYYKYSRVFSRLGFRYELFDKVLLNFTLKAHYFIADYFEWGIGYRL